MPVHPETARLERHLATIGRALDARLADDPGDALARRDAWIAALDGPLPESGAGADAVVADMVEHLIPNGTRLDRPGFWGWITVAPTSVPAVAMAAASVASAQRYTLTAFNHLEELSLEWLRDLCALPPHMRGIYSSGGSTANLVALGAARQWAFERIGVDPAANGTGGRATAVYTSTEAHHTVHRAAGVLGLGRSALRPIEVDGQGCMRTDMLLQAMRRDERDGVVPVAIVAAAGTTNTGAIDPIAEIADIAGEAGVWLHVDGAYGLPGVLDRRVADRFTGIERADSAIVDPHKWLGVPVGVAATFVRDRELLYRAFTQEPADYMEGSFVEDAVVSIDALGVPYGDMGVELSAPARGVAVWAALREIGREGMRARVVADNDRARRVAARAHEHPGLEVLAEPVLSTCCFRHLPAGDGTNADEHNAAVLRRLVRETPYLPSSTRVGGRFAIRPCFVNARTTDADVDGFVDAVIRIGGELAG